MLWVLIVQQGPGCEGATDFDFHMDWQPHDVDAKATRAVFSCSFKLEQGPSDLELPSGNVAYNIGKLHVVVHQKTLVLLRARGDMHPQRQHTQGSTEGSSSLEGSSGPSGGS